MDDRYLRYLKENEPINDPINQPQPQKNEPIKPPIEGWTEPDFGQAIVIPQVNVLNPQESAQVEQTVDNDQTQPEQPMNVQAEINQKPASEKEIIKNVFSKIGWDKYIKEEPINANGQNA
jgi:hypothetical protein